MAVDPGVAAAIASCRQLRDSIGRTAAFNKLSARMTAEDVQRHYGWREQLRDSFAQLFMLWDIRATGRQITEVQAEDLDRGRSCARRIQERIRLQILLICASDSADPEPVLWILHEFFSDIPNINFIFVFPSCKHVRLHILTRYFFLGNF